MGFPHSSVSKESACNAGDLGSIPGLGRSSGEGNDNPLQCSCLENPMDRGAWRATVHGVTRVGHDLMIKALHNDIYIIMIPCRVFSFLKILLVLLVHPFPLYPDNPLIFLPSPCVSYSERTDMIEKAEVWEEYV